MIYKVFIIVFAVLISFSTCYAKNIKVKEVIDGDTLLIEIDGEDKYVSIFPIDSPEIGQPYYEDAKRFVEDVISKKSYDIEMLKKNHIDNNFIYCKIKYKDKGAYRDISITLLSKGLAYYDKNQNDGKKKQLNISVNLKKNNNLYLSVERNARTNRIGVWGIEGMVPPEAYRKLNSIIDPEEKQAQNASPMFAISELHPVFCPVVNYSIYHSERNSPSYVSGSTIYSGNTGFTNGYIGGGGKRKVASYINIVVVNNTNDDRQILSSDIVVTTIKGNKVTPLEHEKFFIQAQGSKRLEGLKFKPISEIQSISVVCR